MTPAQRADLLSELAAIQHRDMPGNGTGPLTVQIGYVDQANMVRDDGIVILAAPHTVIAAVIKWAALVGNDLVSVSMVDFDGPHSRTRGLLVA